MVNVYLKYNKLYDERKAVYEKIGYMFAMEEHVVFDFAENCICFSSAFAAQVYLKYFNEVKALNSEMAELEKLFDK